MLRIMFASPSRSIVISNRIAPITFRLKTGAFTMRAHLVDQIEHLTSLNSNPDTPYCFSAWAWNHRIDPVRR
jgi:hypothetical protein